jgi:predicted ATP-dependent serine protease
MIKKSIQTEIDTKKASLSKEAAFLYSWNCPECGMCNSKDSTKCKGCNYIRESGTVKNEPKE